MNTTQTHRSLWVAYGATGVVGMIRETEDGYTVTMAGADSASGTYPTVEVAKSALHAKLARGSDWPEFRQH